MAAIIGKAPGCLACYHPLDFLLKAAETMKFKLLFTFSLLID